MSEEHANKITKIRKRDGREVEFCKEKIAQAIFKAAQAVGGHDKPLADKMAEKVTTVLEFSYDDENPPSVENVQDVVEKVLIKSGHAKTAKEYILYRQKRAELRETKSFLSKIRDVIDSYVQQDSWRVRENSNAAYAVSGLQAHISGAVIAEYTLNNTYPKEISDAHRNADMHIHDLSIGTFAGYCAGWSLKQLLMLGFNGVPGRVAAKPAKHLNAALGQLVNFFGTLQNEWAGAQAVSSFDTYLAPLIALENLTYHQVRQSMQEFLFAINQTSRWGNQVPFTNITLDWVVPDDIKDQKVIYGGKEIDRTYGEFQKEMDIFNKAFLEVMMDGDMDGRIFTFPIPTYNITKDFNWDSENARLLFEMTGKYGTPYFQNFINSSLNPSDVRSMCCRLQLDVRDLKNKTGGLFGSGELTGSIGVITLNMARIGYLSKTEEQFMERVTNLMVLGKNSLEIKRKEVQRNMEHGLLPYTRRYLGNLNHHFSTIGLCGMNEACLNFIGKDITTDEGKELALKVLTKMRENLKEFQEETGHIFNLEATPAEGTSFRFAKHDRAKYPDIITAGTKDAPYYTNSSQLPVGHTEDIFEAMNMQDELQSMYTGGTVLHGFIGEQINDWKVVRELVRKIATNSHLPYFSITPTFSICPVHGYISGKHFTCPYEHTPEEMERHGIEEEKIEVVSK